MPLFETIEDLRAAPTVMEDLFNNMEYHSICTGAECRRSCLGIQTATRTAVISLRTEPVHRTAGACGSVRRYGVKLVVSRRGGSIKRRTDQPRDLSQPPKAFQGPVKITEQGEVIAYRYSNEAIARRHLQQVANAVLTALGSPSKEIRQRRAAMDTLRR